ncbi:kinase-like domain-containing protein [Cercophora samala]|uniref:non-specific serine/threonine protein kinase n=1 Tax=Cercophora samala TaxID=330535 RepID=A0AA39ZI66_9PEZI|nr:kinase-like domain-containing protein [Cercophora samala]
MSLVPYHEREGREIVLRHHNAIVVRDPTSQRLEIRGLELTQCPTCHQSLRTSSPERHFDPTTNHETYVNPDYFRMLRAGQYRRNHTQPLPPPSSPIRRLVEPFPASVSDEDGSEFGLHDTDSVRSSPAPRQGGGRIRREAFSPNYFNTFFIEERELGRGGKGVVLLVRHEIDGCFLGEFACKRVPVGDDHAWLEKVLVEVELLAKLSHPNLVSYRHVWLEDYQTSQFAPVVACAFILQQYCNGGDLLHYVIGEMPREATKEQLKAQMRRRSKGQTERPKMQRRLPPEEIYSLFKDITSGLAYLHAANYIHRDLKPSNCLLHREGTHLACLISDFGEVQPENAVRKSTGSTGTISYCAPEVLKKDLTGRYGNFTTKSDIFSLGMILYFMCFGRLPYHFANAVNEELEDIDQLRAEITDWKGFHDERRERPDLPHKLYQLLQKLLAVNPLERPTANEVLGAMKGELPLDGVNGMRGARNSEPSLGLAGHRIQNLDSPMPPGSPMPDPAKQARVNSLTDEDDFASSIDGQSPQSHTTSSMSLLQKRMTRIDQQSPRSPRRRGSHNSLALARSHSHSPERLRRNGNVVPAELASPANITTPLLMPPPTTALERVRNEAVLVQWRASRWWNANSVLLRLVLFASKMMSMSWVCWPYSSSMLTMGSLLAMATLDLVDLGARDGERDGAGAGIEGTSLDQSGSSPVVIRVGPDGSPRVMHPVGGGGGGGGRRPGWLTGWRRSWVLLAAHFVVLWVASRAAVLCAVPVVRGHGEWESW